MRKGLSTFLWVSWWKNFLPLSFWYLLRKWKQDYNWIHCTHCKVSVLVSDIDNWETFGINTLLTNILIGNFHKFDNQHGCHKRMQKYDLDRILINGTWDPVHGTQVQNEPVLFRNYLQPHFDRHYHKNHIERLNW